MGWVEQATKYYDLVRLLIKVSQSLDVNSIQTKYNLTKKRLVRLFIKDANKYYTFQLSEGKLIVKLTNPTPDVTIMLESLCTIKHLRLGRKAGCDPATGQRVEIRYTPWNAWRMGDIVSSGDASTNDMLSVMDIFTDIVANVPESEVVRILGACSHD